MEFELIEEFSRCGVSCANRPDGFNVFADKNSIPYGDIEGRLDKVGHNITIDLVK